MLALSVGVVGCGGEEVPEVTEYTLTISSTEGGEVTVPGEGTFIHDEGEVVGLVAEAEEGYRFAEWTGDVNDIADVKDATTTIAMSGNYSITADFEAIPPIQYDLTIASTVGGSVTMPGEGIFAFDDGTVVDLMAEAEQGYYFVNWTGDVDTIDNVETASTTIIISDACSITADFEETPPVQVGLTISSTAGGSVTVPGEGSFLYDAGTVADLLANPLSGYYFQNWTGDVSTIANVKAASTTITMNDNCSIMASFEVVLPVQYSLTISSNTGGSVTAPGEGTFMFDDGTVVSLVATPLSDCYPFAYWTGDVGAIANVNAASTTITMNDNYSITAYFPGVVDLANTELHEAATAIICCLADAGTDVLTSPCGNATAMWCGELGVIYACTGNVTYDAADYISGPFRATYTVTGYGQIVNGACVGVGQWGSCITWDSEYMCWKET